MHGLKGPVPVRSRLKQLRIRLAVAVSLLMVGLVVLGWVRRSPIISPPVDRAAVFSPSSVLAVLAESKGFGGTRRRTRARSRVRCCPPAASRFAPGGPSSAS